MGGKAVTLKGECKEKIYPDVRVRLIKEKPFYGIGPQQLLELTEQTGVLREACHLMGLSYSKGRIIISTIEQQMGCKVIESQKGGKNGGRSVLTEAGKELMQKYSHFSEEAKLCVAELFKKHFEAGDSK